MFYAQPRLRRGVAAIISTKQYDNYNNQKLFFHFKKKALGDKFGRRMFFQPVFHLAVAVGGAGLAWGERSMDYL